jgi:tetratricopeptide (TPR) repeat protein
VPAAGQEAWEIRDDGLVDQAEDAIVRGRSRAGVTRYLDDGDGEPLEDDVRAELARAVGRERADRYEQRLGDASRAFRADRFQDAARMLRRLAADAPGAPSVRELYGLSLYRLGRWRDAARELEAFRHLTGNAEQDPVLADCYRALRRYDRVDELWRDLRAASPDAATVTEGRIVAAGALADRGELPAAIALLAQGFKVPKRPQEHHLRRAYALADLYERAGEVPRARELFGRVRAAEPGFADVGDRLKALR